MGVRIEPGTAVLMKAPNHGCLVRLTTIGDEPVVEFEGRLALDPCRLKHVPQESGLVLLTSDGDLLIVYRTDRIELVP